MLEKIKSIIGYYANTMKIKKFRIVKQSMMQTPNVLLECVTENNSHLTLDSGISLEEANSMYSEFIDIVNKDFIEY